MQKTSRLETESPRIRLVTLDWSGTVSDDRNPVWMANMAVLRDHQKPVLSFEEWLPNTFINPMEFYRSRGISGSDDELFRKYKRAYDSIEGNAPKAYADAKEVLKFMAEFVPLIVISSHPEDHLLKEASGYGMSNHIKEFKGGVRNKAATIAGVCANFKIKPQNAIYVGDMTFDILAGKEAGVWSVAITTGYHQEDKLSTAEPDLLVNSLAELGGRLLPLLRKQA
ncbi:Phosphoglycolate phosphatase [uncultured archaeon]|nr:Phosphoglycolate phosphatase [uncultured archaeon]